MRHNNRFAATNLSDILHQAESVKISGRDRIIIFSDLHMGNGGPTDDFLKNSELFLYVLRHYYLRRRFHLILNGDVEELQKFSLKQVLTRWQPVYDVFHQFNRKKRLFKLLGNHDDGLQFYTPSPGSFKLHEALRLEYKHNNLFVFHGHQASLLYEKFNTLVRFFLRVFANPLHIKNYSVAGDNRKKDRLEKRVYEFARRKKTIALIGHTHRPLFESLSKFETYRRKIEELCREYPHQNKKERRGTRRIIDTLKNELEKMHVNKKNYLPSIYDAHLVVPCVFNSGCVIGKRGITGIELAGGKISLVHWFNREVSTRYLHDPLVNVERLGSSGYYRAVLKKEPLDYIFTRIELLT
jgi:UDP-2,3-diacylglucosamine pyrophosphatase LpxH